MSARRRRTICAVDLKEKRIVIARPGGPSVRERGHDPAIEGKERMHRILDIDVVAFAALVDAAWGRRAKLADDALHRRTEALQHVAPVGHHIEHQATAVALAVIPARALAFLPLAIEDPGAGLDANGEDTAEEAGAFQSHQRRKARQVHLVLDHAVANAGGLRKAREFERLVERGS